MSDDHPWRDEGTLYELYVRQELSSRDVADELGCQKDTVLRWLDRHNIPRRGRMEWRETVHPWVGLNIHGYVEASSWNSDRQQNDRVLMHRLLAVAEYGFDAVAGKLVHHRNGIPWDNRPPNVEPVSRSSHAKHHYDRGDLKL